MTENTTDDNKINNNKILNSKIENNVAFLDIETQHIMQEFPGGWKNPDNYAKLKIAELGLLIDGKYQTYEEDNVFDIVKELKDINLIIGHNILNFDYSILKHYFNKNVITDFKFKTFDTMLEFDKFTDDAGWCSLDDLAFRNFGMKKTHDSIKIPEMWREGKHDTVKEYLLNDLKMTEAIYNLGKVGGNFKYEHKVYGQSKGERTVWVKW